jgi:hypothetical protein
MYLTENPGNPILLLLFYDLLSVTCHHDFLELIHLCQEESVAVHMKENGLVWAYF